MFGLGTQELFILVWIALLSVPSIIAALFHNKFFQKNNPKLMPYRWGYFQAWSSIFTSIVLLIIGILTLDDHDGGGIFLILVAIAFALTGIGVIWRTKWGWALLCLMSISTVIAFVIDVLYAKNRWKEFSSSQKEKGPKSDDSPKGVFWVGGTSGEGKGPFSYKEIESQIVSGGISRATLVWKEGMADWLPASETELKSYFFVEPPPLPVQKKTLPPPLPDSMPMAKSKDDYKDKDIDKEVSIKTYPSGLIVHIDERKIFGTTPLIARLSLGPHLIQLFDDANFIHAENFSYENQKEIVFDVTKQTSY